MSINSFKYQNIDKKYNKKFFAETEDTLFALCMLKLKSTILKI